jgi:hypothetical protein
LICILRVSHLAKAITEWIIPEIGSDSSRAISMTAVNAAPVAPIPVRIRLSELTPKAHMNMQTAPNTGSKYKLSLTHRYDHQGRFKSLRNSIEAMANTVMKVRPNIRG